MIKNSKDYELTKTIHQVLLLLHQKVHETSHSNNLQIVVVYTFAIIAVATAQKTYSDILFPHLKTIFRDLPNKCFNNGELNYIIHLKYVMLYNAASYVKKTNINLL